MSMNEKLQPCFATHQIEDETSIVTYQCFSLNGRGHTGPHTTFYLGRDGKQRIRVTWLEGQQRTKFRNDMPVLEQSA